jgi:integral membrane protein (TIGR01906 family)
VNKSGKFWLKKILQILAALSVPVVLSALLIRLLLTPVFVNLEYRLPGFPEDPYGFTQQDRLQYAHQARRYLVTDRSLDSLRELSFPGGEPLFNERELSHLRDVKVVIKGLYRVAWAGLVMGLAAAFWSYREKDWGLLIQAVSSGGWLTVGMVVLIITLSVLNFQSFFFKFHRVFFEGDTWLFYNSDTLIRLFPLRFWRDAFLLFGGLSLAAGAVLAGLPAWVDRKIE